MTWVDDAINAGKKLAHPTPPKIQPPQDHRPFWRKELQEKRRLHLEVVGQISADLQRIFRDLAKSGLVVVGPTTDYFGEKFPQASDDDSGNSPYIWLENGIKMYLGEGRYLGTYEEYPADYEAPVSETKVQVAKISTQYQIRTATDELCVIGINTPDKSVSWSVVHGHVPGNNGGHIRVNKGRWNYGWQDALKAYLAKELVLHYSRR